MGFLGRSCKATGLAHLPCQNHELNNLRGNQFGNGHRRHMVLVLSSFSLQQIYNWPSQCRCYLRLQRRLLRLQLLLASVIRVSSKDCGTACNCRRNEIDCYNQKAEGMEGWVRTVRWDSVASVFPVIDMDKHDLFPFHRYCESYNDVHPFQVLLLHTSKVPRETLQILQFQCKSTSTRL